jgi:DNA-binding transcriptional ArsR family regulator
MASRNHATETERVLAVLADPTRRRIVELLSGGPQRAGALADATNTPAPTMSRHLRLLREANVVADARLEDDARARVFRLRPESLVALRAWLDQLQAHWDEQLDSYKQHVDAQHVDAQHVEGRASP